MFDEIYCEFELPNMPVFLKENPLLQTKDIDLTLTRFTLDKDGYIDHPDLTQTIDAGASNIRAAGPGVYTSNGEDAVRVEYKLVFKNSKLIYSQQVEYDVKPALPVEEIHTDIRHDENIKQRNERIERINEDMAGKDVFILSGLDTEGRWAKVVAQDKYKICVKNTDDELELLNKQSRDNIFFDSEEEAYEDRRQRQEVWEKQKQRYQQYVESRQH